MSVSSQDRRYMAAAMRLSRWHTGLTATNPSVAALVVRDGAIVGQAVTAPGGRPHAETQALAVAGDKARGATLYVTLEPCSHHGKTPPCADAIVAAGISRVVVSLTDPDPRVSGRGLAILRQAGIAVESGVMEEEGRRVLAAYLMRQTRGRPYVTLKLAVSNDGMIGRKGESQVAITGPAARAHVHALRAETDAILVGIGTALADDPELTCRAPGLEPRSPLRIVLDRRLDLPVTSKLAKTARDVPVLLAATGLASAEPATPLSGLPAISSKSGEIDGAPPSSPFANRAAAESITSGRGTPHLPVSPPVGEMPGRAEGGNLPTAAEGNPATPADGADQPTTRQSRRTTLTTAGVEILETETLATLLNALAARGISSLMVEGGAAVAKSFLAAGLVDRILLFEGAVTLGPAGAIASPVTRADIPAGFRLIRAAGFGPDRLTEYERSS